MKSIRIQQQPLWRSVLLLVALGLLSAPLCRTQQPPAKRPPSGAELLLRQALEEYKAASAIGHHDLPSSQRKYVHAVHLLEELTAKYPSFRQMDRVLLLQGKCKREIDDNGEGGAFIKQHPADYQYFEVAGLEYTGTDFSLLIAKFPQSALVPDAAYELALGKVLPECESEWDCYLHRALDRFEPFIRQYPTSVRVRDAIRSINSGGFRYLDEVAKDKIGGSGDVAKRFESQLARYHALSERLDSNYWAEAATALAHAYEALHDTQLARETYTELLQRLPRDPKARIWQSKLKALSTLIPEDSTAPGQSNIQQLYSADHLTVLQAARLIAASQDVSYLPYVKGWIRQNRQLADLQEDNSLCELLRWTFQQDPRFIYNQIANWQGGRLCVWTIPDPTSPRRIISLPDEGHTIKWVAARQALWRFPEPDVIRSLRHRDRAVRRGAIFVVMQKRYSRAIGQIAGIPDEIG